MKDNADIRLRAEIERLRAAGQRPRLLVQCCCAPCSSHVLTLLAQGYACTAFFYNPNIMPQAEFDLRLAELQRFVRQCPDCEGIGVQVPDYRPQEFLDAVRGLEQLPEGGQRCTACYTLRLQKTAEAAAAGGYDAFTTTLSVSPHKDAARLNEIGQKLSQQYGVAYLPADFKKNEGYKRSIALSAQYGLYRQDYCGCPFSKR